MEIGLEDKFKQVLYKNPKLTYFGWGVPEELKLYREGKTSEIEARRKELRDQLFNSFDEFERAYNFCTQLEKLTKINPKHTSYSYKQHAEEYCADKVSNGAFIAAAIAAGFKKRVDQFNPNVWFNINERSLVRLLNSKTPSDIPNELK